ncbi:MAG: carboxymuconolactone decarboxylase family protein [bacterium]|nr:carboxymuconolactone decarboxylase family protein [bacterium]
MNTSINTPLNSGFKKRIFTFKLFLKDYGYFVKKIPAMISMMRAKRVSRAFSEKIMLATTSVNECVLCARFHSEMALSSGIGQEEVTALLNMDLGESKKADDEEVAALLYAQHYAETGRNPKEEATKRLYDYYGEKKANDIMLIIRMINMFNLTGNTFAAFTSRLRGNKAPNSSLLFELFFVFMTAPVIIPSEIYIRTKNNFDFKQ